jgi:thymidylate synthase
MDLNIKNTNTIILIMKIEAIVCYDSKYGISRDNTLPWLVDGLGDLEYVNIITTMAALGKRNVLIVGSKTASTLPSGFFSGASNRDLCILSRDFCNNKYTDSPHLSVFKDPEILYVHLLRRFYSADDLDKVFIFGGSEIYKIFLERKWIHTFHITQIDIDYACDTIFPYNELVENYTCLSSSSRDKKHRTFQIWERNNHPEYQYLELLQKVYYTGEYKYTRNGVTLSLFGERLEFDIGRYGFPLLTTKKMFFKGVAEELFWFFRADTNANNLKEKGVHIWDGNTSREFLDNLGLTSYGEGIAGPIYGYQWRNFNGEYNIDKKIELETPRDQLYNCLKELQYSPNSRRIIFTGWNPLQIGQMCLPPCHVIYQFYVKNNKLSCQMYQRSADLFLGLPFNIASTALLTSIFASMTGYTVDKISICIGDAHIYSEHNKCILEQLVKTPLQFCKLKINNIREKLEDWTYSDISIEDYKSHGPLKAPMKA